MITREEVEALLMSKESFRVERTISTTDKDKFGDAECAKIDKMAELVTREIELYKKLKRSLINEVVTGKREVA